jgi:hypothetical protein
MGTAGGASTVQGYIAHKKHPPPRTLQQDYLGSYGVLEWWLVLLSEIRTPIQKGCCSVATL